MSSESAPMSVICNDKKKPEQQQTVILHAELFTISVLQSMNINITELFAMITVYKARRKQQCLVFMCDMDAGKRGYKLGVEKWRDKQAVLGEKIRIQKTEDRKEKQSEETARYFDLLHKCSTLTPSL